MQPKQNKTKKDQMKLGSKNSYAEGVEGVDGAYTFCD
jgi:hypothetical protein